MGIGYVKGCNCLSCNSKDIISVFEVNGLPLADRLNLKATDVSEEAPLTLLVCNNCSLVFIKEQVASNELFPQNYPYFTGVSSSLVNHFYNLATFLINQYHLNEESLVIDIGSNDGTALKTFAEEQIQVLGIEPTTRASLKAILNGITTLRDFWNYETSQIVIQELKRKADVVLCNNVTSHVDNPATFIHALENVCKEETIVVAEFPYLKSIVEKTAFDIIFHQHVCYFTITTFERLISQYGFYINDAEVLTVHGGNLRVYFSKKQKTTTRLATLKYEEEQSKINETIILRPFIERIKAIKHRTLDLLDKLKADGKKVMECGAAGKATLLAKYLELDSSKMLGIIGKNEFKQGKFFPAHNLPIHSPSILNQKSGKVDYLLILTWTLKAEIISGLSAFQKTGGRFIVALPELEVI